MTQIGYGPLWRIDGPPPLPRLYGLLPAAEAPAAGVRLVIDLDSGETVDVNAIREEGQTMDEAIAELQRQGSLEAGVGRERWLNGVEVYPYPPDRGDIHDACSDGDATGAVKGDGVDDVEHPQFGAITAYVAETCKSYKVPDQAAFKARAVAALVAVESAIVARHFRTGEGLVVPGPFLADGNAAVLNGGLVTSPINGLALLEQAISDTERQGLIHISPQLAITLSERLVLDNRSGVLRTINGTVVIPDAGYAELSSSGGTSAAVTEETIYATGPVDIRRSEIFVLPENVSEALDRGLTAGATRGRSNTITYRAERYYLIDWDTELQAEVTVDRCQTTCS